MALNRSFHLLALLGGAFLAGVSSCSSSLPELTIDLGKLAPSDTLAYVTYIGEGVQETDTLVHFSEKISLSPDTARFRTVSLVHASGAEVLLFSWDGRAWQRTPSPAKESAPLTPLTEAYDFRGRDIQGKERSLSDLYRKRPVVLVFASPERMQSLTKQEQAQLRVKARPDSLQFVFLYPSLSDSTVRAQLRRDSLEGIAFSDSLGLVTRLRHEYGVQGKDHPVRFRIDTLGKIKR